MTNETHTGGGAYIDGDVKAGNDFAGRSLEKNTSNVSISLDNNNRLQMLQEQFNELKSTMQTQFFLIGRDIRDLQQKTNDNERDLTDLEKKAVEQTVQQTIRQAAPIPSRALWLRIIEVAAMIALAVMLFYFSSALYENANETKLFRMQLLQQQIQLQQHPPNQ